MRRLVLDAGPLIALASSKDHYHQQSVIGFHQLGQVFGEVLTPLPIVFEVYKFVSREASKRAAQQLLNTLYQETVIVPVNEAVFTEIYDFVSQLANWKGSLEDASVILLSQKYDAEIWTIDYRDLGYFQNLSFWSP